MSTPWIMYRYMLAHGIATVIFSWTLVAHERVTHDMDSPKKSTADTITLLLILGAAFSFLGMLLRFAIPIERRGNAGGRSWTMQIEMVITGLASVVALSTMLSALDYYGELVGEGTALLTIGGLLHINGILLAFLFYMALAHNLAWFDRHIHDRGHIRHKQLHEH